MSAQQGGVASTDATRVDVAAAADELIRIVDAAATHLQSVSGVEAAQPRGAGKWSKKEELGHLLDSAVNNHHRFVRAQQAEQLAFPKYEQNEWVTLQTYQDGDWSELVPLWRLYNRHLARVIRNIPPEALPRMCAIGSNEPVTLGFLVEDYVAHMKHHLRLMRVPV